MVHDPHFDFKAEVYMSDFDKVIDSLVCTFYTEQQEIRNVAHKNLIVWMSL